MPLFDIKCSACGYEQKDVIVKGVGHHFSPSCPRCHRVGTFKKETPKASFVIKGYSAKNGYSGGK